MAEAESDELVLSSVAHGVATITLNRPARLNAINGRLSRALNLALDAAARSEEVRVILLMGAGRAFCAGADDQVLSEYAADPKAQNSGSGRLRYGDLMQLPKPVIAAVHGACAGVGVALACCADIRLASADAFFLAPFARLGLTAEVGLGWLLPRLVGTGNAMDILMSAERIMAEDAKAMGLVRAVFAAEDFATQAEDYARKLAASGAPSALRAIKEQVYAGWNQDFSTAEDDAARLTFAALEGPDFAEAIRARKERRQPSFTPLSAPFLEDR